MPLWAAEAMVGTAIVILPRSFRFLLLLWSSGSRKHKLQPFRPNEDSMLELTRVERALVDFSNAVRSNYEHTTGD